MTDIERTPGAPAELPAEPPASPPPAPPPSPAPAPTSYQPPSPPPGPSRYERPAGRGFWTRFFDFSFHEFITPSIIKVLFILAMVVIGLGVLSSVVVGFMASAGFGIVVLIGALIYGFIALLFSRVALEIIIIFFRIHDDTREIAASKRN